MRQLDLLPGYFHCHNCGDLYAHTVRRIDRFYLCPACAVAVLPDFEGDATTAGQRQQIADYWAWREGMVHRYPRRLPVAGARRSPPAAHAFVHDPICSCGQPRRPLPPGPLTPPDLFGGPFYPLCPVCETRASINSLLRLAAAIHPDYDDEDWLDLLARSMPEAFTLGVLPDYWFQRTRQL